MPIVRSRRFVRFSCLFVATSVLAGCSGGGDGASIPAVSVSAPVVEFGPAANADGALRPVPNGFAFPNFAAASLPANELGPADMVKMFGDGPAVCASGAGDACVLTSEAVSWAQMVNDSRQSGHCEGFIVQSLDKFRSGATPTTADLGTTDEVVQGIIRGFATQFIPETRGESRAWRKKKTAEVVAELVASLKAGPPKYVLGVYGDLGGHAILPYAVEFSDAANALIQVYDSNWPGRNRFVAVNVETGDWSFSFDGPDPATDTNAWTGGDGGLDLSSLDSRIDGTCPFCDDGTTTAETMLTIRATSLAWKVQTSRGMVDPDTTVEGVDVARVRAGITGVYDYVVSIDPSLVDTTTKDAITVTLPPRSVVYAVTPAGVGRAVSTTRPGSVNLTETSLSTTDGLEIRLAAGDDVVLAGDADDAVITIEESRVTGTATVGGRTVEATTNDDEPKIALVVAGTQISRQPLAITPAPDTPVELAGTSTATRLPEPETRVLANITPDPVYQLPTVVTTTTVAPTTTTGTTGEGETTAQVTTTTRPRNLSTTTTTTSVAPTTATTSTSTTTTAAPTTTTTTSIPVNQAPVFGVMACSRNASELYLTVPITDPENDTLSAPTFTLVSAPPGNTLFASPPSSGPGPNQWTATGIFSSPYQAIVLTISVNDNINTTTVQRTVTTASNDWNDLGSTCSIS